MLTQNRCLILSSCAFLTYFLSFEVDFLVLLAKVRQDELETFFINGWTVCFLKSLQFIFRAYLLISQNQCLYENE